MQVLIAVVDDLFQFVCKAFSGAVPYSAESQSQTKKTLDSSQVILDTYQESLKKIQNTTELIVTSSGVQVQAPVISDSVESFRIGEQYYIGEVDTFFYQDPVLAFDSALRRLEYGSNVRLISLHGRWAQVRLAGIVGWVFKDSLVLRIADVSPQFIVGVQYDAQHPETVKLRACIGDEFGGARGEHDLSAAEYIHYCLQQKKRVINWGDIRMRIPGTWQRKLRGCLGVHIGITPKTESVMEYAMDDMGHLAFVESVFPDGSMKVTEIGKMDDSSYTEEILHPEQWKELSPVFIDIE